MFDPYIHREYQYLRNLTLLSVFVWGRTQALQALTNEATPPSNAASGVFTNCVSENNQKHVVQKALIRAPFRLNKLPFRLNKLPLHIQEGSNFNIRYVRLCDLDIPVEKRLDCLQTVENLIRGRILLYKSWFKELYRHVFVINTLYSHWGTILDAPK